MSAVDQNELRQLDGLELDKTFTDKASGKDVSRPQLELLLSFIRDGDTLVCHSMDRLARNLDDLRKLVLDLTGKGVHVQFVKENLVFTGEDSPMANLLLSVMGAFAQFERELIRERQREGNRPGEEARGLMLVGSGRLARPRLRPCSSGLQPASRRPCSPRSLALLETLYIDTSEEESQARRHEEGNSMGDALSLRDQCANALPTAA